MKLLNQLGFLNIPKAFLKFKILKVSVYSFVNGVHPPLDRSFIASIVEMSKNLFPLENNLFSSATDSINNCEDLLIQAKNILSKLNNIHHENNLFHYVNTRSQELDVIIKSKLFYINLPQVKLVLSDAGPHNTLRNNEGIDFFIDFEFFGYDSPYKFIADTLNHPRNRFSKSVAINFLESMGMIYELDHRIFTKVLYASALKWEAIILRRIVYMDRKSELSPELKVIQKRISILKESFEHDFDLILDKIL